MEEAAVQQEAGTAGRRTPARLHRHAPRAAAHRPGPVACGSPPPVPPFAIRRPRLEELLDDRADQQVVLVRGPVGAGKTVLVAQWAHAREHPCAWLSIDVAHNDQKVLLHHLVEVVQRLSPDAPDIGRRIADDVIDNMALWELL